MTRLEAFLQSPGTAKRLGTGHFRQRFEIINWTKGKEREQKKRIASMKNQGDIEDFIKAFIIDFYLNKEKIHSLFMEKVRKEVYTH